jgi:hypothetical protein
MENLLQTLKDYFVNHGWNTMQQIASYILTFGALVTLVYGVFKKVSEIIKYLFVRFKISKDLENYYDYSEIRDYTNFYIQTNCQTDDPCESNEPLAFPIKRRLLPLFLGDIFNIKKANKSQRLYLILADSGMGKTAFMMNLFLSYKKRIITPYKIILFPLGHPLIDEAIVKIPENEKKNSILLLDGFDEDYQALSDYKIRMKKLIEATFLFKIVIITSRTQFFPNEKEEPNETSLKRFGSEYGFQTIKKIYISPFDDQDIKKYLKKRFPFFSKKRKRAIKVIANAPNLMMRPMLLHYIEDLVREQDYKINYKYEIYKTLIDKWISRESNRYPIDSRHIFKENLYLFSKAVAKTIYINNLEGRGLTINEKNIVPLAESNNIRLSELELKSRSLLNRNSFGTFKFSHKSILEYFLAEELFANQKFLESFSFEGMEESFNFYFEMQLNKYLTPELMIDLGTKLEIEVCTEGSNYFEKLNKLISSRHTRKTQLANSSHIKILGHKNSVGTNVSIDFVKCFLNLRSVLISNCNVINEEIFLLLKHLEEISFYSSVSKSNFDYLQYLDNLKYLILNNCNLKDIGFLAPLTNIVFLDLAQNNIESLKLLFSNFSRLKYLDISQNEKVPIEEINYLKRTLNCNVRHTIQVLDLFAFSWLFELSNEELYNFPRATIEKSSTNSLIVNLNDVTRYGDLFFWERMEVIGDYQNRTVKLFRDSKGKYVRNASFASDVRLLVSNISHFYGLDDNGLGELYNNVDPVRNENISNKWGGRSWSSYAVEYPITIKVKKSNKSDFVNDYLEITIKNLKVLNHQS